MFFDSWVLDWFAILNIATIVLAAAGLVFDRLRHKG